MPLANKTKPRHHGHSGVKDDSEDGELGKSFFEGGQCGWCSFGDEIGCAVGVSLALFIFRFFVSAVVA